MTVRDFCKKICQKKTLSDRKKAGIFVSIVLLQHWLTVSQGLLQENMSKKIIQAIVKAGVFAFNHSPAT